MLLAVLLAWTSLQPATQTTPLDREKTGAGLLSMCEKYEYSVRPDGTAHIREDDVPCHFYVMGFLDSFDKYQGLLESWTEFGEKYAPAEFARLRVAPSGVPLRLVYERRSCIPTNAEYDQIIRVVVKYLRDHPERLHEHRRVLIPDAIGAAFPCPKK